MKIRQEVVGALEVPSDGQGREVERAQLVLVFGGIEMLANDAVYRSLRRRYPSAVLFGCSTAGEICGTRVFDHTLVANPVDPRTVARARLPVKRERS